jgi:hypothetical protein
VVMRVMLLQYWRVVCHRGVLNASRSRGRRVVLSMRVVVAVGLMVNVLGRGRRGVSLGVTISNLMGVLLKW